jgi:hypothetical protein
MNDCYWVLGIRYCCVGVMLSILTTLVCVGLVRCMVMLGVEGTLVEVYTCT